MVAADHRARRTGATVRGLLTGCHPGPTLAVTTLATLLSVGVGLPAARVVLVGAAVLTGQLAIGWANDALDAGRDRATGRTDKPAARGEISPRVLQRATVVAVAATVLLSAATGWRSAVALLVLVGAGLAYDVGLKATWWSGAAYVVGFGALPAAPYLALDTHPGPPWWAPVTGALLGLAAHVGNVLPDLAGDIATGVRGLPHRLGPAPSRVLLAAALAAAGGTAVVGSQALGPAVTVLLAVLVVLAALAVWWLSVRRPDSRLTFAAVVATAVFDVVVFVVVT